MDRLEANYGYDRISFEVSRIGANSHITIVYDPPYLLAHVADCIAHDIFKDDDIGF